MPEQSAARKIHPLQDFRGNGVTKDFTPRPPKAASAEAVEEDPKVESARESAHSLQSTPTTEQTESGTDAQTPASKENGQSSEENGPTTTEETSPSQENSSPDSSSATSPGWQPPPAPVAPPTSEKTQTQ